ncbi:hypothetical protein QAD02_015349 [Eretmocerus hayati]|uniref:Uncharacterized protein n=1 Tax=Eretmocerus hayati TaxID=131215 RepID=A0ACC2P801_9HYME|nr:hypothetical protein QAD02_015349 [Eretmocerus hayati]
MVQFISDEGGPLTPGDMEKLLDEAKSGTENDDEEPTSVEPTLTVAIVTEIINHFHAGADLAFQYDPIVSRSLKLRRGCEDLLRDYQEIQKDLIRHMKQSKITDFLNPSVFE